MELGRGEREAELVLVEIIGSRATISPDDGDEAEFELVAFSGPVRVPWYP
jgi:hypothetical protein